MNEAKSNEWLSRFGLMRVGDVKMKKAYICTHANFPRKDAVSNYIYSLAKCLQLIGYKVIIVSRGCNSGEDWCDLEEHYVYRGICYDTIGERPKSLAGIVRRYFYESRQVLGKLKSNTLTEGDCIFVCSINYFYVRDIYKYAKKRKVELYTCILEHYQPFQYKRGRWNPVFWMERLGFQFGIPINRKVIVISQYLQHYFNEKNCKTFILPPLVDVEEYRCEESNRSKTDFCNIIYSGNPSGKDDMNVMVRAILKVNKKNKVKIRFHITGCSEKQIRKDCNFVDEEWEDLKQSIYIHSWMEYEELIKLYWNMDFFLLARHKNRVTLANFPSKVPELMACGVIPIVSEVGDYTRLYVQDGQNGIVFQNCSVDECAAAIERAVKLTDEEKEILSYNAQIMVKEKLDYHMWGQKMKDFLE